MTFREFLTGVKVGFRKVMGWDLDPYGFDHSTAAPKPTEPTAQRQKRAETELPEAAESSENLRTAMQFLVEAESKIDELRLQLANITEQRDAARHEVEEQRGIVRGLQTENARLTEQIHIAESYMEGMSIDEWSNEQAALNDDSDEYYEEHKAEWEEKGLTNMDMYDEMKAHAKAVSSRRGTKSERAEKGYRRSVMDFTDEARTDVHDASERVDSALKEAKLGNTPAVPREIKSGPLDIPNDDKDNNVF